MGMPSLPRTRLLPALVTLFALTPPPSFAQHPLDALNEDEIIGSAVILQEAGAARPDALFQSVSLYEPSKGRVLAGAATDRRAEVYYRQQGRSFRSVVNLSQGSFTRPVLIPQHDGQLGLTIGELLDFGYVYENADFLGALAARGISSEADLAQVFITPLTAGSFGIPAERKRIVRAQAYFTEGTAINLYARPIEGVQIIADLDAKRVLRIIDTGLVPVPTATHEFDEASVAALTGLRDELRPVRMSQPDGVNFTFDDGFVEWQKWRFHLRFDRRVGAIVSLVNYDGRSVMYQGSLSEIFVPYQDPDENWYYRTFMDAGEFGMGLLSSPLALGLDVPDNALLLDAVISAAIPDAGIPVVPLPVQHVMGVIERLTGNPMWRHFEQFSPQGPTYEGRAAVELVVRTIAQVGNYDYIIDWVFAQNGAIRVEVGLTGIDVAKGVSSAHLSDPAAEEETRHGALVAPNLVATHHSHHFNFRLDLDIDGRRNSFVNGHLELEKAHGSPRRGVWVVEDSVLRREKEGRLDDHHSVWKVINPERRNALGYPTGYRLEAHGHAEALMFPADYRRAAFIQHDLWLTAYNRNERYASGVTPNQHPGIPGLPEYQRDDERVERTDIVLWPNISFHHVTAAEDYPVLSREHGSFELHPHNFFDRNPALDLRRAPFEAP